MIPIIILTLENPDDREFMSDFYLASEKWMYHEARRWFPQQQDAEDIVYESVVRLIDKVDVLQNMDRQNQIQYAVVTVRNISYNVLRRKGLEKTVSFDELEYTVVPESETHTEDTILQEQRHAYLASLWEKIGTEARLLLEQKYILKWSDAEIAEDLHVRPQSIRMRLTRIKRTVAKSLYNEGFCLMDWL